VFFHAHANILDAPKYHNIPQAATASRFNPMTPGEAHKILGTAAETPYEKIQQTYEKQMKANENYLYIQSKIFRAKECIDQQLAQEGFDFSKYKNNSSFEGAQEQAENIKQ